MTLRTRLLLGLVALAAFGFAFAGAVTYRQQHHFLVHRVDEELDAASRNQRLFPNELRPGGAGTNGSNGAPVGTYALLIDASGNVIRTIPPASGDVPKIPDAKIASASTESKKFTVESPRYRVLVESVTIQGPFGGAQGTEVIAIPLRDVDDALHRLLLVEMIVAVVTLIGLAALAWMLIKLGLRPLQQMQETAGAIAAGDLSRRVEVPDETTEVGKLGLALNEMMHQIETAFDARAASESRLRRFIADASHELRTPLTSIRGYAELFRRGAAERPEDLAKTMRRIEEEANRMGVLVEDLLLLARLDQGRPLEQVPVDLTRLARDAVDDTRAVAPSREIDYTPNGAVLVPGDEVRLRQILANLMQNAIRHTPADTPVHVRVQSVGDEAVIEVADEGPGMAAEEASRVFERFWRADSSRARTSGGTGLGLAIVAAIADAHGGHAEVTTAPGAGATFRVFLPSQPPPTYPAGADTPSAAGASAGTPAAIPIAELEDSP